jgi:hypothetical protein
MTIAGEDLLVVMRATAETGRLEDTANYYVSPSHAERFCTASVLAGSCNQMPCCRGMFQNAIQRTGSMRGKSLAAAMHNFFAFSLQNNHNSNAVSFHRVRQFRQYANVEWATWTVRP